MFAKLKITVFLLVALVIVLPAHARKQVNAPPINERIVNWEKLRIDDHILTETKQHFPFSNRYLTLDSQEKVTVLLPESRHFYMQFFDEDGETITPERFFNEPELQHHQLRLLLSETPGISQQYQFDPQNALLPAVNLDRVIQITNDQEHEIRVALFSGQEKSLQNFAPLSWLAPEDTDSERFRSNDQQFNDFYQTQEAGNINLEENRDYWLESLQPSSEQWQNTAVEFLQISAQNGQAEILPVFNNRSAKKRIESDAETVTNMTATQFKTNSDTEISIVSTAPTRVRIQSMQADWLFEDNYQELSAPAVAQKNQEVAIHSDWHQQQFSQLTFNPTINSMAHQAITRWMVEKVLTGTAVTRLQEQNVQGERLVWDFETQITKQPDLAEPRINIAPPNAPETFAVLSQQNAISFQPAHDQISNSIAIEALVNARQSNSGISVLVDQQPFTTLHFFSDTELHAYIRNEQWQPGDTVTKPETYIARQTLYLPKGWQTLTLVAEQQDIPVRARYQALRIPKLARPQWQALLQLPGEEREQQLAHHPLWQEFKRYQAVKGLQFNGENVPEMWQNWLQQQRISSAILDHPVIASMPEARRIQKALLTPKMQSWPFWEGLFDDLQLAGWQSYGENLLKALVLYHPDATIKNAAIARLLAHYQATDNLAEQTNLLISVSHSESLPHPVKDSAQLALASLYLTQDKPEYTLFTLMNTKDSFAKQHLMERALFRLHPVLPEIKDEPQPYTPSSISAENKIVSAAEDFIAQLDSKAVIQLYNVELQVPQKNYLITPEQPLKITLSGATKLHFTARQWFTKSHVEDDWLTISQGQQKFRLPVNNGEFRSATLRHPDASVGAGHKFAITADSSGVITIATAKHPVVVNIQQSIAETQRQLVHSQCVREETQHYQQDWWYHPDKPQFECYYWHTNAAQFSEFAVAANYLPSLTENNQSLLNALYQFETEATQQQLNRINQLAAQNSDSAMVQMLLRRANKNVTWVALNYPIQAKKFTFYTSDTNEPLSPDASRSRLLYAPYKPDWEKLAAQNNLNYELVAKTGEEYRLLLQSQQHLFQREAKSRVTISLNGEIHNTLVLNTGELKTQALPLTPGKHTLTLATDYLSGQNAVIAKLQFRTGQGDWQEQPQDLRLRLFQADSAEPFQIFLPEDSWLRIDSFDEKGLAKHQYLYAEKGMFNWFDENPSYLGHRILQLKLTDAPASATNPDVIPLDLYPSSDLRGVQIIAASKLKDSGTQKDYSWGVEGSIRQQRSTSEDAAQNNRYQQIRLFFRDSDVTGRYFYGSELAVRRYQSDFRTSLHARFDWWDTMWLENIDLHLGVSVNAQQGYLDKDWGWSARLSADAHWQYAINRRFYNRMTLGAFVNLLDSDKTPDQYASAVYSQYKLDHKYGFSLAENIRYKWYHDLESWADVKVTSNELSGSKLLDNMALTLGSRIYYEGLSAEIGWRWQKYFSDADRVEKSFEQRLGAGLEWFNWQSDSHLRLRLGYERNLTDSENYWSLQLSYIESGHRGVSDYLPQTLAFSAIREQEGLLHALELQAEDEAQQ